MDYGMIKNVILQLLKPIIYESVEGVESILYKFKIRFELDWYQIIYNIN